MLKATMITVTSGILKGIGLQTPKGLKTRPSTSKLRQAILNVLRNYRNSAGSSILENAVVADLFCGSGALGIEAISNGSNEVWFVESDKAALKVLKANILSMLDHLKTQNLPLPKVHILSQLIEMAYPNLPLCNVLFADPPYKKEYFEKLILLESRFHKIPDKGLFIFESEKNEPIIDNHFSNAKFSHFDTKIYGDSAVHYFVKKA